VIELTPRGTLAKRAARNRDPYFAVNV
jgi:hypothetical protein